VVLRRLMAFCAHAHESDEGHCGVCEHEWHVEGEWLDRFNHGEKPCPVWGTDCQVEDRPNFWAVQDDPSYDDLKVRDMHWHHTSTHSN
jgi:hypothetical protein